MDEVNRAETPVEEKCCVCGRILEKGEGRFRCSDGAVCLKCHDCTVPEKLPGNSEDARESK